MVADSLKVGVLLSGSGTNLQAIADEVRQAALPIEVVKVISSRPDAYGLVRAHAAGISTAALNRSCYANAEAADAHMVDLLRDAKAQYVVMAGYMRKLTHVMLNAFPDRVLNLHPSLLPSFKGAHAIKQAFDAGVKITGVTVHFANEDYDKGPIVAQEAVKVRARDTLADLEARIHTVEHLLYPKVLRLVAQGRVSIGDDRKVYIRE